PAARDAVSQPPSTPPGSAGAARRARRRYAPGMVRARADAPAVLSDELEARQSVPGGRQPFERHAVETLDEDVVGARAIAVALERFDHDGGDVLARRFVPFGVLQFDVQPGAAAEAGVEGADQLDLLVQRVQSKV